MVKYMYAAGTARAGLASSGTLKNAQTKTENNPFTETSVTGL